MPMSVSFGGKRKFVLSMKVVSDFPNDLKSMKWGIGGRHLSTDRGAACEKVKFPIRVNTPTHTNRQEEEMIRSWSNYVLYLVSFRTPAPLFPAEPRLMNGVPRDWWTTTAPSVSLLAHSTGHNNNKRPGFFLMFRIIYKTYDIYLKNLIELNAAGF